jgi:serine/threonine protein phosphatase PrpC
LRITNIHQLSGKAVETLLRFALFKKSGDNITALLIGFDKFKYSLFKKDENKKEKKVSSLSQN